MLFHDIQGKLERVPPFLDGPHEIWATTDAGCVQPWRESEALNGLRFITGSVVGRSKWKPCFRHQFWALYTMNYYDMCGMTLYVTWHKKDLWKQSLLKHHPSWRPWSSRGLPRLVACAVASLRAARKRLVLPQNSQMPFKLQIVDTSHGHVFDGVREIPGTPRRWCCSLRTTNKTQQFIRPGLPFSSGKHHKQRTDQWVWGPVNHCLCLFVEFETVHCSIVLDHPLRMCSKHRKIRFHAITLICVRIGIHGSMQVHHTHVHGHEMKQHDEPFQATQAPKSLFDCTSVS